MKINPFKKALKKAEEAKNNAELITAEKSLELENTRQHLQKTDKLRKASESVATELKKFIKTANVPIFGIDIKGLINKWNQAAEKLLGFKSEEVLGNSLKQYINKSDLEAVNEVIENALQGKETANYELPIFTKDGLRLVVLLNLNTRFNTNGQITGVLGVGRDVTDRALRNKEKENRADELIIANEKLTVQNEEEEKRADKLFLVNKELAVQNEEDEERAKELVIANKELIFQNIEKEKRAAKLIIANQELVDQNKEEQKRTKSKIKEAEDLYRLLANHSKDLICLHEPDSTLKYISPSIKNLLGYKKSDFLGKKIFSIVHKDDVLSLKNLLKEKIFRGTIIDAFPFRIRHKNGHFIWLEFLVSPVYKENKINYYVSSSRDITHWMLAKQDIQEYQTSLQKLTTEISLVEEKQKKEIASNIHDHLSQSLIISKMKINELKKNPQIKVTAEDLQFIEAHISEALENSRKITYELSPPVLYQLGIIAALNWLLDDFETTHKIKCKLNSNVTNIILDDAKSILLFRSIQEVITNTIKHAKASLITLDIDKNNLGLNILIIDNGVGFNTGALNNQNHSGSGFGLFTVKERIRNIQGTFKIVSEINKGTTVKFQIPISL